MRLIALPLMIAIPGCHAALDESCQENLTVFFVAGKLATATYVGQDTGSVLALSAQPSDPDWTELRFVDSNGWERHTWTISGPTADGVVLGAYDFGPFRTRRELAPPVTLVPFIGSCYEGTQTETATAEADWVSETGGFHPCTTPTLPEGERCLDVLLSSDPPQPTPSRFTVHPGVGIESFVDAAGEEWLLTSLE